MAVPRQVDLLEPIDLAEHLGKVELYLGQVCQIAGISKMQLDYWTNQAQIPTKGKKQRIYDIELREELECIWKQRAVESVRLGIDRRDRTLVGEPRDPWAPGDEPPMLLDDLPPARGLGSWFARQPRELRMRVRQARARLSPFIDQGVQVAGW